ncbi:MAG: Tad domain-containing protein [Pseudomonadota bacterium]
MVISSSYIRNTRGSVMPLFVISTAAIVALVGATLALSMDSRAATELQVTADNSALAGATAFINVKSAKLDDRISEAEKLAKAYAKRSIDYRLSDFEVLAKSEDAYGQTVQLAVEMEFDPVNAAASIVGRNANVEIRRKAKAEATWGFPLCTLSLSGDGTGLKLAGEASLDANNCLVWANTSGRASMEFTGGKLRSKYACTHGQYTKDGFASVIPNPSTQCRTIPDPLADWKAPLPGSVSEVRGLSDPLPVEPDLPPNLKRLRDAFDQNPDGFIRQIRNLLKEPSELDCCFAQYAYELQRIGDDGIDPERSALSDMTIPGTSASLDRDQLDDVTGPAEDNDWSHPRLNIDQEDDTELDEDSGRLEDGPAEGYTLWELAQAAGLADPSGNGGEEPVDEDRYYNSPTLTLSPGTFRGLHIFEGHIRFTPGVYHIVGAPLILRRRATMTAEGVTFVLHGDNAYIEVLDEARLEITAPTTGPTAGFAIAQNKDSIKSKAYAKTRLAGSGSAMLIGTVYLPKQNFEVTGSGTGEQESPLLQIVANELRFDQNGQLKIDFDEAKTEVPVVIKPERTARLIE